MFEDSLLTNLIIFALGQVAAWGYLRTGRVRRGVLLLVGAWVFADAALLARFAYDDAGSVYLVSLLMMQAYSMIEFLAFFFGRIRRRLKGVRQRREAAYRGAFGHFLRDEIEPAERAFRKMMRVDPWDTHTAVSLGVLLARSGRPRRARAVLRAARSLDRAQRYTDLIGHELEQLRVASGGRPRAVAASSSLAS